MAQSQVTDQLPALQITRDHRILLLAPHPDDEVLSAGGLLQRAAAANARVDVLFITDGESNPWPQRALMRKWKISETDKRRWGRKRQREARAALVRLGIAQDRANFLGLPDQGVTQRLMRDPQP